MSRIREYWIRLENQVWDASPWGIDRREGKLTPQPGSGLFRPASGEILILTAYGNDWAQPLNQPFNAWDLAESTGSRNHGALPGCLIEAKVADEIIVHFRNQDMRQLPAAQRVHGLHAHGVQRIGLFDGAFPLSPPDPQQGNRRGDRIRPGESFTYRWTCPQKAAAGVWLLHDAGPDGRASTAAGAFGVIVIRAPGEQTGDLPDAPIRQINDTSVQFGGLPDPPRQADYMLVFHRLPGVGLCLNGRQRLGNTPTLLAGTRTRMTIRCLNATFEPLSFHIHGHRWQRETGYVDAEILPAGGGATLSMLSDSAENGGGMGEWLIVGQAGDDVVHGSLVVAESGPLTLQSATT
ncbi:MAG: multicopper oxidase domain-containing protein [Caldilineales bacterium]|nr:multicopper oxidase domain-containing protein [Caldilineales bacterium]